MEGEFEYLQTDLDPHYEAINVLLIDNLILKTNLADVSIGYSNPPQCEMNLDCSWMRLVYFNPIETSGR